MASYTRTKENPEGWGQYLRTQAFTAHLRSKADEFVDIAKGEFWTRQQNEEEPPVFYMQSFYVRRIPWRAEGAGPEPQPAYAYRVGNLDDIASLVEFGAHAGEDHQTPVLGYRVFGRTMDIMGAL